MRAALDRRVDWTLLRAVGRKSGMLGSFNGLWMGMEDGVEKRLGAPYELPLGSRDDGLGVYSAFAGSRLSRYSSYHGIILHVEYPKTLGIKRDLIL
jgi:hypothetical protein